ncbi:AAA family ATPase [Acidianus sulfidivorans JP7]|uniref:AAA family ATPase n=1 Tax=Acidianus sulfidivorans JP7 TaxID=619593 RepID=A0A2U9ILN1_9CREN|nr:AAA family ATPase [Acidianus sulfidivorans]AWR96927.1 AAA family ATPase [Acidianus sulfidivorans JP7]
MEKDLYFARIYSSRKIKQRYLALLDSKIMRQYSILPGNVIIIYGDKFAPFLVQENREENNRDITISEEDIRWLGVRDEEKIIFRKVEGVPLDNITLSPSTNTQKQLDVRKISIDLRGKPVMRRLPVYTKEGEFVVVAFSPQVEVGLVTGETNISIASSSVRITQKDIPFVTLEDIGGLSEQIQTLLEIAEVSLLKPEISRLFGLRPPKGVLLYGPPGTGKTLLAKAIANSTMANFFYISGPEVASKYYGESEKRLREIFEQAAKESPSIIFIDEIDAITPSRDSASSEADRRIVAQLLTLMDGVSSRSGILVIGATNRPNAIDPALRRPGRFDREIEIPVPGKKERLEILKIHTRRLKLSSDVDLEKIAEITHGFVGADLEALVREAVMTALKRVKNYEDVVVTQSDFIDAMKRIQPSGLREFRIEIPNTSWEDIIGLEDVKLELKEVVEWPLKDPSLYEYMNAEVPSGILLYGPPGTGKTMLARAVAHESGANFIAVNGPELLNMWVGESERAVREIFKKARQASPTIVFFDEIDALAVARGSDPNRVTERIVSQLLTEMDGISKRSEKVISIAATNRPDILDPALLRPGRLEKIIYVPPPDFNGRKLIFANLISKHPHEENIDYDYLAKSTEFYTPADIKGVINRAVLLAIRRGIALNQKPKVTQDDIISSINFIKPTLTPSMLSYYQHFTERIRQSGGYA